jgi:hypothetical protein
MNDWAHDDLQADLAQTRAQAGDIVVQKLGLGPWGGHAQADIATIRPSWTTPLPTIYEIKVSRSDFLSDVQSGKYKKYLPYVQRLYFAVPKGLVTTKEVPENIGLCWRGPKGWYTRQAPRMIHPHESTWNTLLFAILLAHYPGPWRQWETRRGRTQHALRTFRNRELGYIHQHELDRLKLSGEVRRLLQEGQAAQTQLARLLDRKNTDP